jgi:hypothetical protein
MLECRPGKSQLSGRGPPGTFPPCQFTNFIVEMRNGQRNPGPLQRLGRHEMSALWFDEIVEEIFHLRLRHGWRQHGTRRADFLHRHAQFLRHVRHRQTASALRQIKAPNSKLQAPEKLQAANIQARR